MVRVRIATLSLLLWLMRLLAHRSMIYIISTPESCDEEVEPQSDDLSRLTLLMGGGAGLHISICLLLVLLLSNFLTIRVRVRVGFRSLHSCSLLTFGAG